VSCEHVVDPRRRGRREALRVLVSTRASAVVARTRAINHLKALIVSAPESLRAELRGMTSDNQISYCAALRPRPSRDLEHRTTVRVLRSTALRILALRQEANDLEAEIEPLVAVMHPQLLTLTGVGPISAAQVLISWSHPGRFRSEAALAAFAGASPIPASSGRTTRHRLNRGGDRQLNRALHTIVLTRARLDPATQANIARRVTEGKSTRDAKRCLKTRRRPPAIPSARTTRGSPRVRRNCRLTGHSSVIEASHQTESPRFQGIARVSSRVATKAFAEDITWASHGTVAREAGVQSYQRPGRRALLISSLAYARTSLLHGVVDRDAQTDLLALSSNWLLR
jgi:hypothetical protein